MTRKFSVAVVAALLLAVLALGGAGYWHWHTRQPDYLFERGLRALHANDPRPLRETAARLRNLPGCEPRASLLQGAFLVRVGMSADGVRELGPALADPKTRILALTLMGEALYKLGQFQDAVTVLSKALEDAPDDVDIHRWLVASYYDLGANLEATRHLLKVAELAPADGKPHRLLGLIHKDNEQYEESIKDYRESLRREPDQAARDEVLLELAQSLARVNRFAEALEAVSLTAESADVAAVRAECFYGEGRPAEAREAIDRALKLQPDHLQTLLIQGTIDIEEGHATHAAQSLLVAVRAHPKDFAARYKLAQAYSRLGKKELAAEQTRAMQENKRLKERSATLYQEIIQNPHDAGVRFEMGQAARELDQPDLAKMWFRAALAIEPKHAGAQRALQEISGK